MPKIVCAAIDQGCIGNLASGDGRTRGIPTISQGCLTALATPGCRGYAVKAASQVADEDGVPGRIVDRGSKLICAQRHWPGARRVLGWGPKKDSCELVEITSVIAYVNRIPPIIAERRREVSSLPFPNGMVYIHGAAAVGVHKL